MNQVKLPREPEGIIIGYHQVPVKNFTSKRGLSLLDRPQYLEAT